MSSIRIFYNIIVLFALIKLLNSYQCYQCRSDKERDCDDLTTINKAHLKKCVRKNTDSNSSAPIPLDDKWRCRKIVQTLQVTNPSETIIIRECTQKFGAVGCNKTANQLMFVNVCDCATPGCNAGDIQGNLEELVFLTTLVTLTCIRFLWVELFLNL